MRGTFATIAAADPASLAEVSDAWPGWSAVLDTLLFRGGFNTSIVVAGTTLLGLAAGVVGMLALLRKRSLMADALGHATLPGIAIVFLAATALGTSGRSMPLLLAGAAATGVLAMLAVQAILRFTRLREDAAIAIVLSVSFAIGVVLLSIVQTTAPAGAAGIHHLVYGQTAAMRASDAIAMASIAAASLLAAKLFLKEFALVAFDEPFARSEGWPIGPIDLAMMALVVLVTVAGLQAVGLILVVAMLIVPAAAARFWTERLSTLLWLSAAFGAAGGYFGAVVSALLPRKPAGAVIVLVSGSIFVASMLFAPSRGIVAAIVRRARLRLRIAGEHVLETAFESWRRDRRTPIIDRATLDATARERGWPIGTRFAVRLWLRLSGFTVRDAAGAKLAAKGLVRGAAISRNHRLWEQYLVSHADLAPSHVDWSVDQVEHVLSAELVASLEQQLRERGIEVPRLNFHAEPTT